MEEASWKRKDVTKTLKDRLSLKRTGVGGPSKGKR
jgi:hypothetical protein